MMSAGTLDLAVVDNPSREEFARIVRAGRPVTIRGATDHWPALREWSAAYFRKTVGHRMVPIEFYHDGTWYGPWTTVPMRLDRYLDILEAPGDPELCYLAQVNMEDHFPELIADMPVPDILCDKSGLGAAAFIGRDSATALHYHSRDEALLCQVNGKKRVTLWGPAAYRHMRYHHTLSYRFNFSAIDFGKMPAAQRAGRPHEVVLEQGDALFIPLFWGHLVGNLGHSSSVTFFWRSVGNTWTPLPLAVRSRVGFWFRRQVGNRVIDGLQRAFGYS